MKHDEIVKAIQHIYPDGVKFVVVDEEIQWMDENKVQPTLEQLQSAWSAYQIKVQEDAANAAEKKAAAEAKLAALGLTAEDLKALGLS